MVKTVLVTDEAAQAHAQAETLEQRDYVDVDGNAVSGEEVVRSIEEGAYDTSKLEALPEDGGGTVAGGALDIVNKVGANMLEYKVASKLLKTERGGIVKKGLTWLGVSLLQHVNVLPTSIQPLLGAASSLAGSILGPQASALVEKVAEYVPEPNTKDTSIVTGIATGTMGAAEAVANFAHGTLGDKAEEDPKPVVTEGSDFLERDEGDQTLATAEDRVRAIYANVFGEDAPDLRTADPKKVGKYMEENGKLMATDGVFASCADKAETDREFAGMRAVTAASCAMLEDVAGRSGKKAAKGFMTMAQGLAAYEAGAREGFGEKYPDGAEKAEAGLEKVMDASRGPLVESIRKMQAEHGLFTEDQLEELRELVPELAMDPTFGHEDEYMPDEDLLGPAEPSTDGGKGFQAYAESRPDPAPSTGSPHRSGTRPLPEQPSGTGGKDADGPELG